MATQNNTSELGTAPIQSLLIKYAVPAIISMVVSSLYNIIDSIFIGHIPQDGARCITALAIAFPLMNLSAAFGSLVGAGGATMISIKMGQKDEAAANKVLGNVFTLNVIIGVVIMVGGLVFLDQILALFGATPNSAPGANDGTVDPARAFMEIILLGNVLTHLFFGLNHSMRSSGHPRKAMSMTLLTVLLNLTLAPIFIYVFEWGIRGAALATIIAQTTSLLLIIRHFRCLSSQLRLTRANLKIDSRITKGILSIGIAPFTLNACACIVTVLFNNVLREYGGNNAIGAYGVVNRVLMIAGMIVLGFNQGMQPIAGYNFGAGHTDRVKEVLKVTIKMATIVMIINFALCELIPDKITSVFVDKASSQDAAILSQYAASALRISAMLVPLVGFQMVVSNFFQSIGRAPIALFMSATRQLIFLAPSALILPHFFGLDGVWYAMPLSDGLAVFTALIVMKTQFNKSVNRVWSE